MWPTLRRGPLRRRPSPTLQQRKFSTSSRAFRSGLEESAEAQIKGAGLRVNYENLRLAFTEPAKARHYTPDFVLPNGVIIETKGLFQTDDRQKHILVRGQHPLLDIRFVFSNAAARIAKKSKTTYAAWADKLGFKWAHKVIPIEWLTEAPNLASLQALAQLGFKP